MICFVIQNSGANHFICISTYRESPPTRKDWNSYPCVGWIWGGSSNWNYYVKWLEAAILVTWKLRTNHWVWFTAANAMWSVPETVCSRSHWVIFIHPQNCIGVCTILSALRSQRSHDDVTYKCEICMNEHNYTNPQIKLYNPQQTHQRTLLWNTPKKCSFLALCQQSENCL